MPRIFRPSVRVGAHRAINSGGMAPLRRCSQRSRGSVTPTMRAAPSTVESMASTVQTTAAAKRTADWPPSTCFRISSMPRATRPYYSIPVYAQVWISSRRWLSVRTPWALDGYSSRADLTRDMLRRVHYRRK
jgi:hypothetical protein